MYGRARFSIVGPGVPLLFPATALVIGTEESQGAVVQDDRTVLSQKVGQGQDVGKIMPRVQLWTLRPGLSRRLPTIRYSAVRRPLALSSPSRHLARLAKCQGLALPLHCWTVQMTRKVDGKVDEPGGDCVWVRGARRSKRVRRGTHRGRNRRIQRVSSPRIRLRERVSRNSVGRGGESHTAVPAVRQWLALGAQSIAGRRPVE